MHYKKLIITLFVLAFVGTAGAQQLLTLDTCRARALRANSGLKRNQVKLEESEALQKAALWQMLPKVSANGGYTWMEKQVNLLSNDDKERLNHLGDNMNDDIRSSLHSDLDGNMAFGSTVADAIADALASSDFTGRINEMGHSVVEGMETDTRNTGFAIATVTQPIYMGGKLTAAYRTARLMHHLSGLEYDKEREATLVAVDAAYWQVVSVQHKKELADRYEALLDTLERNVQLAMEAEMATKGDLAKVRVKHNEARMNQTKATNGLHLAKMLLAQRCGMPLESEFSVGEVNGFSNDELATASDNSSLHISPTSMEEVYEHRGEMQMLRIGDSIAREGVRMAASGLKPNIVVTGGYLMSNPNVFDGFSNTWGGTWIAGVAVNVPLVHIGSIYALKAAKAKRRELAWQTEEAKELIALQVNKVSYELELAYKKKAQAESLVDEAEENLRLANESFEAGMCNSSDLMMAQTAWLQAQTELVDANIEIEMGKIYLKQALGREL